MNSRVNSSGDKTMGLEREGARNLDYEILKMKLGLVIHH